MFKKKSIIEIAIVLQVIIFYLCDSVGNTSIDSLRGIGMLNLLTWYVLFWIINYEYLGDLVLALKRALLFVLIVLVIWSIVEALLATVLSDRLYFLAYIVYGFLNILSLGMVLYSTISREKKIKRKENALMVVMVFVLILFVVSVFIIYHKYNYNPYMYYTNYSLFDLVVSTNMDSVINKKLSNATLIFYAFEGVIYSLYLKRKFNETENNIEVY